MKKNIYLIIAGIIMFGIGLIIMTYEVSTFKINTKVPVKEEELFTYYLDNRYNYNFNCNNCEIKYVKDDDMKNTFTIKVRYPKDYYSYIILDNLKNNTKYIDIKSDKVKIKDIYNLLVRDIKNKNIRNYFNYFKMKVVIYTSSDNFERLGIENEK